jgi:glycosyltransferase involved in cell wall biosynthesis
MRILTVGNMYPPHHQGGYEVMWQAVVHAARERGHDVRVLTSDHREPGVTVPDSADVHRELRLYWSWEDYAFRELGAVGRARLERANAAALDRHIASFAPDAVSWWAMGTMSLSLIERVRRRAIPASFAIHDDWLVYGFKADRWIRAWHGWRRAAAPVAERLLGVPTRVDVPAAGPMVFNSAYIRRRAREAGVDVDGAMVVHPGVDERFLVPAEPRPWGWRLLCVGRLDRHKGTDTAVAALEHLPPEATLTVVGSGDRSYVAELEHAAERLGASQRVAFAGFRSGEDLRSAYAEADAVLFPVRWEEPFGLVPLEAMGVGRPVVTTARGGSREFLADGENSLVVEPDDPGALAAAVGRLARDENLRARLREAGRTTAGEHGMAAFAARMVDAIEASA